MEKITLEMIEKVLDATKEDYPVVKEALIEADGDVEAAIKTLKEAQEAAGPEEDPNLEEAEDSGEEVSGEEKKAAPEDKGLDEYAQDMIDRLKKKVQEGNVDRIKVSREGNTILNIPLNLGLLGGIVTMATIPWALILGVITAFGLNCKIEVISKDGDSEEM